MLAVLMHKSLNSLTPLYLPDECQLVFNVSRCHLLSADTCNVPCTQSHFGDRSFTVAIVNCGTVSQPSQTSNCDSLNDYLKDISVLRLWRFVTLF